MLLTQAGSIASFLLGGAAAPASSVDIVVPIITGIAAAIQKGYVWNDPSPSDFPEVPQ